MFEEHMDKKRAFYFFKKLGRFINISKNRILCSIIPSPFDSLYFERSKKSIAIVPKNWELCIHGTGKLKG